MTFELSSTPTSILRIFAALMEIYQKGYIQKSHQIFFCLRPVEKSPKLIRLEYLRNRDNLTESKKGSRKIKIKLLSHIS